MYIRIKVNERIFKKDPESSELGRKIVTHSIRLIDEMGFEQYTFRKLAEEIQSTEATVYRYFDNKHKVLIYLIAWYWNWLEHQLAFGMHNLSDPVERLRIALRILSHTADLPNFTEVDIPALYRIVVGESPKAYLTKDVDEDNREGFFLSYKRICRQVAEIVEEINPSYSYPRSLISTVIESTHNQKYFSEHLPSLTEVTLGDQQQVADFVADLVFRTIGIRESSPEKPLKNGQ